MSSDKKKHALIVGAGPAGLTAGVELLKTGKFKVSLIEREKMVGGLARTTDYKGYKFDIGPHHFITEAAHIEKWWKDLMGKDFIALKRFTRIYYNKHFFNYPLDALNVVRGLRITECVRSVLSYVWIRLFPIKEVKSFQDWVTNKFGARLFNIFFKTYTEKVWGIPCNKISSDWAAQRIKGFSLSKAIFYAFFGRWFKKNAPRTLSDTFYYPPYGSGTLWNKVASNITSHPGGSITLDELVVSLSHENQKITAVYSSKVGGTSTKKLDAHVADYFFSTMPLRKLILSMDPAPPEAIRKAAQSLGYRGLITVNLIIDKANMFPDHWLYIHEKSVKMGRIGNMNNFSLGMVADTGHTALSLEYFTFVDDEFWKQTDEELLELGAKELEKIGIVDASRVIDGMIMRTSEAYPLYDENYREHLTAVLGYLSQFENLQLMGRNGLHRYNNMDLAMISAMEAVQKVLDQEGIAPSKPEHTSPSLPKKSPVIQPAQSAQGEDAQQ